MSALDLPREVVQLIFSISDPGGPPCDIHSYSPRLSVLRLKDRVSLLPAASAPQQYQRVCQCGERAATAQLLCLSTSLPLLLPARAGGAGLTCSALRRCRCVGAGAGGLQGLEGTPGPSQHGAPGRAPHLCPPSGWRARLSTGLPGLARRCWQWMLWPMSSWPRPARTTRPATPQSRECSERCARCSPRRVAQGVRPQRVHAVPARTGIELGIQLCGCPVSG